MNESYGGHTLRRYDSELHGLHQLAATTGEKVLGQLIDALAAVRARDTEHAAQIIQADADIDRQVEEADNLIVELLARRAPVATDLRLVMAVSKIVGDLERIGDEAVRIASLADHRFVPDGTDPRPPLQALERMGELAVESVRGALDVFNTWNTDKAAEVAEASLTMEEEFQRTLQLLMAFVPEDTRNVGFAINVALLVKALERIGHHSHNLVASVVSHANREALLAASPAP